MDQQQLSSWLQRLPASLQAPAKQGASHGSTDALSSLHEHEHEMVAALVRAVRQQLLQLQSACQGTADTDGTVVALGIAMQKGLVRAG